MATFGERIRQYREDKNLSQEEVADKLGTFKQVVSRYEHDAQVPKLNALPELAVKLGVNPMWLMGFDVSINPDTKNNTIDMSHFSPAKKFVADNLKNLSENDALALQQLLRSIKNEEERDG